MKNGWKNDSILNQIFFKDGTSSSSLLCENTLTLLKLYCLIDCIIWLVLFIYTIWPSCIWLMENLNGQYRGLIYNYSMKFVTNSLLFLKWNGTIIINYLRASFFHTNFFLFFSSTFLLWCFYLRLLWSTPWKEKVTTGNSVGLKSFCFAKLRCTCWEEASSYNLQIFACIVYIWSLQILQKTLCLTEDTLRGLSS